MPWLPVVNPSACLFPRKYMAVTVDTGRSILLTSVSAAAGVANPRPVNPNTARSANAASPAPRRRTAMNAPCTHHKSAPGEAAGRLERNVNPATTFPPISGFRDLVPRPAWSRGRRGSGRSRAPPCHWIVGVRVRNCARGQKQPPSSLGKWNTGPGKLLRPSGRKPERLGSMALSHRRGAQPAARCDCACVDAVRACNGVR